MRPPGHRRASGGGGWFAMDFLNADTVRDGLVPRRSRSWDGPRPDHPRTRRRQGAASSRLITVPGGRRFVERVRLFQPEELEIDARGRGVAVQLGRRLRWRSAPSGAHPHDPAVHTGELMRIPPTPFATPNTWPVPERGGVLDPALRSALIEGPGQERLRARLAEPDALVVTTGQQPALFTGPLYAVHKALLGRGPRPGARGSMAVPGRSGLLGGRR